MAAPPRLRKIPAAPDFETQETRLRGERGGRLVQPFGDRENFRVVAGRQFADVFAAESRPGEKTFGRAPVAPAGQSQAAVQPGDVLAMAAWRPAIGLILV